MENLSNQFEPIWTNVCNCLVLDYCISFDISPHVISDPPQASRCIQWAWHTHCKGCSFSNQHHFLSCLWSLSLKTIYIFCMKTFSLSLSFFHLLVLSQTPRSHSHSHTSSLTIKCYLNYKFVHFQFLNNKSIRTFNRAIDLLKWVFQTFYRCVWVYACMHKQSVIICVSNLLDCFSILWSQLYCAIHTLAHIQFGLFNFICVCVCVQFNAFHVCSVLWVLFKFVLLTFLI